MHGQNHNQHYRRRSIRRLEDDSTTSPTSTTEEATTDGLLTPGERIGVTIGLIILLLIGLYSILMFIRIRRRRRRRRRTTSSSGINWKTDSIFGEKTNNNDEDTFTKNDDDGGSIVKINKSGIPTTTKTLHLIELTRTYDTSSSSSSSSHNASNKDYLPHHYQIAKINRGKKSKNKAPSQNIFARVQRERNNIEQQQQQNSAFHNTGIITTRTGMSTITNDTYNNPPTPTTTTTATATVTVTFEKINDNDSSHYTTSSSAYMTNNDEEFDNDEYNKRNSTYSPNKYESSSVTPSSTRSYSLASAVLNSVLPKGSCRIIMKEEDDDDDDDDDDDISHNVYFRHQDDQDNACSFPKHPFDEDSSGNGGGGGNALRSYGSNHGYDVFAGIEQEQLEQEEHGIEECDYCRKEEKEDSVFDGIQ